MIPVCLYLLLRIYLNLYTDDFRLFFSFFKSDILLYNILTKIQPFPDTKTELGKAAILYSDKS